MAVSWLLLVVSTRWNVSDDMLPQISFVLRPKFSIHPVGLNAVLPLPSPT